MYRAIVQATLVALAVAACGGGTNLAGDGNGSADGMTDGAGDGAADEGGEGVSEDGGETPDCLANADCDDGLRCNGYEVCVGGACRPGTPVNCSDGVDCTEDTCVESPASCRNEARDAFCPAGGRCGPDGCRGECSSTADCDDGEPCNGVETCVDGACVGGTAMSCADEWPCTVDGCLAGRCYFHADHSLCPIVGQLCDPERGCIDVGACAVDGDCDDGDLCNGVETCTRGLCVAGSPMPCDDGERCTGEEFCIDGGCVSGPPPRCDDGEPCNGVETCGPAGCVSGAPPACDDGLFCNGLEGCGAAGACVAGRPPCDDGLACTSDACDEAVERCSWTPVDGDGDGYGDAACGGDDCDDERAWAHPGAAESCAGGVDEDCDGRTDCADETCGGLPECCMPASETCNGADDDCDGTADDGLSCFVSDGRVLQPFATGACGAAFYSYGSPVADSANLSRDVTASNKAVVLVHQGPAGCDTVGEIVVVADRVADGSGGSLRMEWVSDPRAVTGIVLGDDGDDCRYRADWGTGRCRWDWEACCTDGAVLGEYRTDFCVFLRFIEPVGIDEVRVLDGLGGWIARGFDEVISICRVTVPEVP